jgi:putative transposase
MVADVVDFQAARRRREEQSLERHFGLPEGAAWINPDFWDQRHMPSRPGRDAGSIAGDLYAFAKTGGPTLLDNSLEAAAKDNLTEASLVGLLEESAGRSCYDQPTSKYVRQNDQGTAPGPEREARRQLRLPQVQALAGWAARPLHRWPLDHLHPAGGTSGARRSRGGASSAWCAAGAIDADRGHDVMAAATRPEPSPEVKAILKKFCDIQREKYGPDWKKILAAEMAEKSRPFVETMFNAGVVTYSNAISFTGTPDFIGSEGPTSSGCCFERVVPEKFLQKELGSDLTKDGRMKRKRFTEEQIIAVLKEHEAGVKTADLVRKHGISEATFYNWKAKFGGMDVSEAKRLKALEDENAKLKKLLAEQMLDAAALRELLSKKW